MVRQDLESQQFPEQLQAALKKKGHLEQASSLRGVKRIEGKQRNFSQP
jgi:hypothetical protein